MHLPSVALVIAPRAVGMGARSEKTMTGGTVKLVVEKKRIESKESNFIFTGLKVYRAAGLYSTLVR